MTWDWIADTLYMIERDLSDRLNVVDRIAHRDTRAAYENIRHARIFVTEAITKMQKANEKAVKVAG